MAGFFSDLKSILSLRILGEVVLRTRHNDLLGLAGQLAYFFLLFYSAFADTQPVATTASAGTWTASSRASCDAKTRVAKISAPYHLRDH